MLVAAADGWPEAAVAIVGIALVASVVIVAVWQPLATWRERMTGSREAAYRALTEQAVEAQARTATALEQLLAEQRLGSASTAERDQADHRQRRD